MDLGVQTHFGQDWHDRLIPAIERIEADHTRDAVYWARVERAPGVIQFEGFDTSHPGLVSARGIETRLVFNERNPIYEDADLGRRLAQLGGYRGNDAGMGLGTLHRPRRLERSAFWAGPRIRSRWST
ncbi:MAG: hypothetical protein AAFV96_10720 [Pseudomonadota bacterium]